MKKILLFALIALFLPNLAHAKTDYELYMQSGEKSPKWNELLKAGFEAYDSKNYQTALVFLEKAKARGCNDPLLMYKLGIYYGMNGKADKSLEHLEKSSKTLQKQYPNSEYSKELFSTIGAMYFEKARFKEASEYLEKGLVLNPKDFMATLMLGQSQRKLGRNKEAKEIFESALQFPDRGNYPDAEYSLLLELMALSHIMGDLDSSLKYAEMILEKRPNDKPAQSYRDSINQKRLKSREDELIKKIGQ